MGVTTMIAVYLYTVLLSSTLTTKFVYALHVPKAITKRFSPTNTTGLPLSYRQQPAGANIDADFVAMIDRLNKVNDSEDDDSVIFQILGNNPYRRPRAWVALGDSFAAGPGAGDSVNDGSACQRGTDAYPFLIQADPSTPGGGARQFTFKACTGDITTNLMDPQNPNYQLGPVRDSTTFTTLSIGGDDIGFSTILLQCVFNIGGTSCDVVVQRARDSLYGQTVHHNYMDLLGQIVERLDWDQRDDMRTVIYQTGYPQFFDDDTTQCNSAKFSPAGVYVTQDLRRDLNQLSGEANYMLQYWVAVFNVGHTQDPDDQRRFGAAVNFAELDFMYANHRLCRQGVNEPDRRTLDTWFYHLLASRRHLGETQVNSSSNGSIETAEADLDKYFDQPSANASTIPEWLSKTFHPTPQGMDATHQYMVTLKLRYRQGIRNIGGATIDLMVIGDYVLFASQDPNSDIYQGIIPHLVSIFGDRRFYGYPDNTRPLATLNFFGSQQPPYLNARAHECYQTANLRQLGDNLAASADISLQRKVVLLMAGTIDLFNQVDNDNAPARLGEIIDLIFDRDPYAAVIVSQIPMIGIGGDGSIENGLQRRIALYNARVANIVARMQRQGRRILKIHPSATPLEHSDGDFILPNTRGYLRMAFDFAEAIVWAYGLEWATSSGASTPLPGPPSPPGTDDKNVGVVICEQYRSWGNSQGEPTTDEIMKSILRNYNDEDEFISKAACNVTEICKWANNGFHGDPAGPDMLLRNATNCVYAGGGIVNGSDYNQLLVQLPSVSYSLDQSPDCKNAVKVDILRGILDCIQTNNSFGGSWTGKDGFYVNLVNLNYPRSPVLNVLGPQNYPLDVQSSAFASDKPPPTQVPAKA